MSHFVALVMVKADEDVDSQVQSLLAPFNENTEMPEYRVLETPEDVARMAKYYKMDDLNDLAEKMQDWNGVRGEVSDGNLYHWSTYNRASQLDVWMIGGRWDDMLPGNQQIITEDFKPDFCFAIVTPNGFWHQKAEMGWWGISRNEMDPDLWEQRKHDLFKEFAGHLAVVVDCHI